MNACDAFVVLAGQITRVQPAPSGCYLTLSNQDGFFPVQVNPALSICGIVPLSEIADLVTGLLGPAVELQQERKDKEAS